MPNYRFLADFCAAGFPESSTILKGFQLRLVHAKTPEARR